MNGLYTIPLSKWAKQIGITRAYAARLAKAERIIDLNGGNGARKFGRDWYITDKSYYDFKPQGGQRPNSGRPKRKTTA